VLPVRGYQGFAVLPGLMIAHAMRHHGDGCAGVEHHDLLVQMAFVHVRHALACSLVYEIAALQHAGFLLPQLCGHASLRCYDAQGIFLPQRQAHQRVFWIILE
jgi:hypothetical protein